MSQLLTMDEAAVAVDGTSCSTTFVETEATKFDSSCIGGYQWDINRRMGAYMDPQMLLLILKWLKTKKASLFLLFILLCLFSLVYSFLFIPFSYFLCIIFDLKVNQIRNFVERLYLYNLSRYRRGLL